MRSFDRLPFGDVLNGMENYFTIKLPRPPRSAANAITLTGTSVTLHPVVCGNPMRDRRAVEQMARYFLRESGTDFMQFCALERDESYCAFLWCVRYACVGACCFRDRDGTMALQWVWLHPYARNRGILGATWPVFIGQFGSGFPVEGPYSDAMRHFLRGRGYDAQ